MTSRCINHGPKYKFPVLNFRKKWKHFDYENSLTNIESNPNKTTCRWFVLFPPVIGIVFFFNLISIRIIFKTYFCWKTMNSLKLYENEDVVFGLKTFESKNWSWYVNFASLVCIRLRFVYNIIFFIKLYSEKISICTLYALLRVLSIKNIFFKNRNYLMITHTQTLTHIKMFIVWKAVRNRLDVGRFRSIAPDPISWVLANYYFSNSQQPPDTNPVESDKYCPIRICN